MKYSLFLWVSVFAGMGAAAYAVCGAPPTAQPTDMAVQFKTVDGAVAMGALTTGVSATEQGVVVYSTSSNTLVYCDGTEWKPVAANAANNRVSNVATPTANADAATKAYVDSAVAGASGAVKECEVKGANVNNAAATAPACSAGYTEAWASADIGCAGEARVFKSNVGGSGMSFFTSYQANSASTLQKVAVGNQLLFSTYNALFVMAEGLELFCYNGATNQGWAFRVCCK